MYANCAENCRSNFPGTTFYFLPADITTQILNFGLPAPIDIQLQGNDVNASVQQAEGMLQQLRQVPGLVDLRIQQPLDYPTFDVKLDRTKAEQGGYTTRDVAQSMLNTLSGSFQITPMFFLNYKNGVNYNLVAQTPQYRMETLQDIQNIPVNSAMAAPRATPEVSSDVTTIKRGARDGGGLPLQHSPRGRYLRRGAGPRPGRGRPRMSRPSSTSMKKACRAACSSRCAGRCRPCAVPIWGCSPAWPSPSCWSTC